MQFSSIKFNQKDNSDFYKVLQKRVRQYFKDNNISKYGNYKMVIKTISMLLLYFVPYILLLTYIESVPLSYLMWVIMAIGMSGIGMAIMHDANHSAYSKNKNVNSFMRFLINFAGGNDAMWRIQHNVLHHTYTNISGADQDIDSGFILRLSPNDERRKFHKYQFIYAWFLYGFMTILWITAKDFMQINTYKKSGALKTEKHSYARIMTYIIIGKIAYHFLFLALPLMLSPIAWYHIVLGFLTMHFLTGLTLGTIFQTGHVMPSSQYPIVNESGNVENDWAISQLVNTSNFAPKSVLMSWFIGGLNFQIEHHLFPGICHIHYKKIAKIVEETAKEYDLPYYSQKTFLAAVYEHGKMLKHLGKND